MDAALGHVASLEAHFEILEDAPGVAEILTRLCREVPVAGKQVHDAIIVATMLAHGERRLLTFNESDFLRAACLVMVLPPGPCSPVRTRWSTARVRPCQSTPWCSKDRWSSSAMNTWMSRLRHLVEAKRRAALLAERCDELVIAGVDAQRDLEPTSRSVSAEECFGSRYQYAPPAPRPAASTDSSTRMPRAPIRRRIKNRIVVCLYANRRPIDRRPRTAQGFGRQRVNIRRVLGIDDDWGG